MVLGCVWGWLCRSKGSDGGIQEFLAIKYSDGGVLSIDVGRLDLVEFFCAFRPRKMLSLDSLSKKGCVGVEKNRSQLKNEAEETVQHLLNLIC